MGELLTLLKYLDPKEGDLYAAGETEVREMLEDLGIKPVEIPGTESAPSEGGPTVGSLKD